MSNLAVVAKDGKEGARVYAADGLAVEIKLGGSNEPKVYANGQEKAIPIKQGTGNDAI